MYHLYDSEGSDSEDEAELREKREKLAALRTKIRQANHSQCGLDYSVVVGPRKLGNGRDVKRRTCMRVDCGTSTLSLWEDWEKILMNPLLKKVQYIGITDYG